MWPPPSPNRWVTPCCASARATSVAAVDAAHVLPSRISVEAGPHRVVALRRRRAVVEPGQLDDDVAVEPVLARDDVDRRSAAVLVDDRERVRVDRDRVVPGHGDHPAEDAEAAVAHEDAGVERGRERVAEHARAVSVFTGPIMRADRDLRAAAEVDRLARHEARGVGRRGTGSPYAISSGRPARPTRVRRAPDLVGIAPDALHRLHEALGRDGTHCDAVDADAARRPGARERLA